MLESWLEPGGLAEIVVLGLQGIGHEMSAEGEPEPLENPYLLCTKFVWPCAPTIPHLVPLDRDMPGRCSNNSPVFLSLSFESFQPFGLPVFCSSTLRRLLKYPCIIDFVQCQCELVR